MPYIQSTFARLGPINSATLSSPAIPQPGPTPTRSEFFVSPGGRRSVVAMGDPRWAHIYHIISPLYLIHPFISLPTGFYTIYPHGFKFELFFKFGLN